MPAPARPADREPVPPHDPSEKITFTEYLRREEAAEYKHEFNQGYAVPIQGPDAERLGMAGAKRTHNLVATNATVELSLRLRDSGCTVYNSDQKVYVEAVDRGFYPDASVFCGEPEYAEGDRNEVVMVNPTMLFEVLSGSTEANDRGEKRFCYIQIPTLREYVMLEQDRPRVEVLSRAEDGSMTLNIYDGLDATVRLPSCDLDIPMADFYRGLSFDG